MRKSDAARKREWMQRLQLKAKVFDHDDARRRHKLRKQLATLTGPRSIVEAVAEALLAYPRCVSAPIEILPAAGVVYVTWPAAGSHGWSPATVRWAVARIKPNHTIEHRTTEGSVLPSPLGASDYQQVTDEIEPWLAMPNRA